MPRMVAVAVVHEDPPQVFVADDQETLNWVLALKLIAQSDPAQYPTALKDELRDALRSEQWGVAVELWMGSGGAVDVYPSFDLHVPSDVELGAQELEFSPLFRD